MGLIRYYLRVLIRSHFKPIDPYKAKKWEFNTTLLYFIAAWTALGFAVYTHKNRNMDEESSNKAGRVVSPYSTIKKFGFEENTIYHLKGFSLEKEVLSYDEAVEKSK